MTNVIQVISICTSFIITYMYATFLDKSYYDLRKQVNGFSKGFLFLSLSAVIGTAITGVLNIIHITKGVKNPIFLMLIRIFANILAIIGLAILREEFERATEEA